MLMKYCHICRININNRVVKLFPSVVMGMEGVKMSSDVSTQYFGLPSVDLYSQIAYEDGTHIVYFCCRGDEMMETEGKTGCGGLHRTLPQSRDPVSRDKMAELGLASRP